jgi:hypothetical protein
MTIDPLAAIALAISVVSLGFSIEARWLDRHKLSCVSQMSTTFGAGQETYSIEVVVTNLGRRPVAVVEVSFEDHHKDLNQGEFAIRSYIYGGIVDKRDPIDLAENQTRFFSARDLARDDLLKKTKRIDVSVRDSRGKIHISTIENHAYWGAEIEARAANLEGEA